MKIREQENVVNLKMRKNVNSNIIFNFFIKRIINYWNLLPGIIVSYKILMHLRIRKLYTALVSQQIQGFIPILNLKHSPSYTLTPYKKKINLVLIMYVETISKL